MDVQVDDCGAIFLFTPHTKRGRRWIEQNVEYEPWQWMGPRLAIDHRMAYALVCVMIKDGLIVKWGGTNNGIRAWRIPLVTGNSGTRQDMVQRL